MKRAALRVGLLIALSLLLGLAVWMLAAEPEFASRRDAAPAAAEPEGQPPSRPAAQPRLSETTHSPEPQALRPRASRAADAVAVATRIAGRVLRRGDDALLGGVEVTAIADDPLLREPAIVATLTTKAGAFELPAGAVARRPHTLQLYWIGKEAWASDDDPGGVAGITLGPLGRSVGLTLRLDEATTPLDALEIWLDTGWLVRGRVVDNEGHPVSGINLLEQGKPRNRWLTPQTDAQGCFLVGNLSPGQPLMLVLEHFGNLVEGSQRHVLPGVGGEVKDLGDLALPYPVREGLR